MAKVFFSRILSKLLFESGANSEKKLRKIGELSEGDEEILRF